MGSNEQWRTTITTFSLTLVSGIKKRTIRNSNTTLVENSSNVPDTCKEELVRIGPTWLLIISPIQNAMLHMDIMNPVKQQ